LGALRTRLFTPEFPLFIYLGLTLVVAGFAALAFTWAKVAGLLAVPLQIPYIASGGLVGLGLVIAGLAITSIGVKRRDSVARVRKLEKLAATMESISAFMGQRRATTDVEGDGR
jgi:hypothetical protein